MTDTEKEQVETAIDLSAYAHACYFRALLEYGFSRDEALIMTMEWVKLAIKYAGVYDRQR